MVSSTGSAANVWNDCFNCTFGVTGRQIPMQIFLSHVFCAFKTHDVTSFVIDRHSRKKFLTTVPRMTWCDRFSLSCRSESKFECTQADSTISANRPRSWNCVRARVLTPLHEDEIWMIHMHAFLSPVPLNVHPNVESRGLGLPLDAVPIHCCSATFPKQDVLLEELHEGNVSRCDCEHDCGGSR